MKLLIIRHGDPDYSIDSLTERGKTEAALLKKRLDKIDIKKAYVSPLGRAALTCDIALGQRPIERETKDWLREFCYIWDRLPEDYNAERDVLDSKNWLDSPRFSDGVVKESYAAVCNGLDEVLAAHGYIRNGYGYDVVTPNEDTIAFFCHFGLESVLISRLLGVSPYPFFQGFCALTTSVTTFVTEERRQGKAAFRCIGFGDVSHLYVEGQEPSFAARFAEVYGNGDRLD